MTPPTPEELLEMVRLKKKLEEKQAEPKREEDRYPHEHKTWERTPWDH